MYIHSEYIIDIHNLSMDIQCIYKNKYLEF